MITGEVLKKRLGLENFQYTKIARAMVSSIRIFYIWYDSIVPNRPIPNTRIFKFPYTSMIWSGIDIAHDQTKRVRFTPPILLTEFSGRLEGSLFITVDVGNSFRLEGKYFSKDFKECITLQSEKIKLSEYVTLADLKDPESTSDFTKRTTKQRTSAMKGSATKNIKFIESVLDGNDVIFKFLAEATEPIYPENYKYMKTQPFDDWKIVSNPSKLYELWVKVLNVVGKDGWLSTHPENQDISVKDIKDILDVSYVQLLSDAIDFNFQGVAYWLSLLDASIVPQNIKPKRWNASNLHGDDGAFLTKHFRSLFNSLPFYYQQMASSLMNLLKKEGYIQKKKVIIK